jgi:hypothetical protein
MKKPAALITAFAAGALIGGSFLIPFPAGAKVLSEGAVSNGYYWQLVQTSNGTRYYCRSVSSGKFQKHAKCKDAGARKP